jgi:hypothetical protein
MAMRDHRPRHEKERPMSRRSLTVVAFMAVCVLLAPTSALAAGTYTPAGTVGHDVSWPNCPAPTALAAGTFGIVGVTSGRAFSQNSCLGSEYAWAHASGNASLYVNLNAPVGSTARGNTSTPRPCIKNDKLCQSYNYGWNTASAAYGYASATLGAPASTTTWWLDVETSNSWLSNLAANAQVVQGALDYLGAGGAYGLPGKGLAVGVYSTDSMWSTITGGSQTVPRVSPVPVWYATAVTTTTTASGYCGSPYAFTGGDVWLVQFVDGTGIDADYAC